MASLFHPKYTRPLPADAEVVTRQHKGKPRRFVKLREGGKPVFYPLTKSGNSYLMPVEKWWGKYRDHNGEEQRVSLSENKTVAQQMLGALVKKAELAKVGIADPFEDHRARPLAEHMDEWEASLKAEGDGEQHVKQTVACVRRILDGCRFVFMADLSASAVQQYLAGLRTSRRELPPLEPGKEWYTKKELARALGVTPPAIPPLVKRHRLAATGNGKARKFPRATAEALYALRTRGRSIKTTNLYLDAIKAFCNWLVQDRRAADNPLAHLSGGDVKLERRHDRQTLSTHQLAAILTAARGSAWTFRGLAGGPARPLPLRHGHRLPRQRTRLPGAGSVRPRCRAGDGDAQRRRRQERPDGRAALAARGRRDTSRLPGRAARRLTRLARHLARGRGRDAPRGPGRRRRALRGRRAGRPAVRGLPQPAALVHRPAGQERRHAQGGDATGPPRRPAADDGRLRPGTAP
jgi:hypothetical protein